MMKAFPALKKLALLLALGAHLVAPTASAATGFDPTSMLCAPSGTISPQARAAIEELLRLAGAQGDERPSMSGHCGACVMVGCPLIAGIVPVLMGNVLGSRLAVFSVIRQTSPSVHGPPLGLRAPPVDLNVS